MKASPPIAKEVRPSRRSKAPAAEASTVELEQTPQSTTLVEGVILSPKGDTEMVDVQDTNLVNGTPILNGVKAAGEALAFPGASLVIDGNIKGAAIHLAGATLARVLIGPVGWFYFAADSFSKSVSGKSLHSYFIPAKTTGEAS